MKNKIAKILSIVLVVVMIAGTLPIRQTVYAAEDPAIETETPNDSSEETDSTTARTSTPKPTDASTPAPATDDNQESSPSDTSDNQETTETTTDGTSKNTDGNEDNKNFTVTFDTNGGSEIESQQVNNGGTAKEPKDPTKDGFTFGGWYEDATFTAVFDFAMPITADVKVYAKWEEIEAEQPAFKDAKTVNGVTVTVSAPEGVFPKGSYLSVESVPVSAQSMMNEAVENERDANANVAVSYTFDIKVLDAEDNEVQPANSESVKVSFGLAEAKDDNLEAQVYHISDEGNAEALDTSVNGDAVEAVTDGFSFYTVEFTYGTMTYVLPGDSEVKLSDVLSYVGLSGEVTVASGSNDELFSVTKESGEWMIHSHQPFNTEEKLSVTINGIVYEIIVTDSNVSGTIYASSLTDNDNLVLTGDTTLVMDVNKSLKSISGAYALTIQGSNTLEVNNNAGHAISVKSLTSAAFLRLISSKYALNIEQNINTSGGLFIISDGVGAYSKNGSITISGKSTISSGEAAIYAPKGSISVNGDLTAETTKDKYFCVVGNNGVTLTGGTVSISSKTIAVRTAGDIELSGNITVTGRDIAINSYEGSVIIKEGSTVKASADYGIYATQNVTMGEGGTLTVTGTGHAGIEAGNGNITLNGTINVNAAQAAIYAPKGSISVNGDLTAETTNGKYICVVGNNGVTLTGGTVSISSKTIAVRTAGDIELSGNITVSSADSAAVNTLDGGNILIKNGSTIKATGKYGLYAAGGITVEGGTVNAQGSSNAVYSNTGTITIHSPLAITTPDGGRVSGKTIVGSDGKTATEVVIQNRPIPGSVSIANGAGAEVGDVLTLKFSDDFPFSGRSFQWQKNVSGTWEDIPGETTAVYTAKAADQGRAFRVRVTVAGYSGEKFSNPCTILVKPTLGGSVSYSGSGYGYGSAYIAGQIHAVTSNLTPSGVPYDRLRFAWQTSADGSTDWTDISGASSSTYTPKAGDHGKYIRVVVSAQGYTGTVNGPALKVKKRAAAAVIAPDLDISGGEVRVKDAQPNQEYLIFSSKQNTIPESAWASAQTPDTVSALYLGGTANSVNYVYTRVKETENSYAGAVASSSIYLGSTTYLQDFYLDVTFMRGGVEYTPERDEMGRYNIRQGDVLKIDAVPVPSDATNYWGISGQNWLVDNQQTGQSTYGGYFQTASGTYDQIQPSESYKTVYFKPNQPKNGVTLSASLFSSSIGYKYAEIKLNIGTEEGEYLTDNLYVESNITIRKGEILEGFSFSTTPEMATTGTMTAQLTDGTGTPPVITFNPENRTFAVNAEGASVGTYKFNVSCQNGTATDSLTVTVISDECTVTLSANNGNPAENITQVVKIGSEFILPELPGSFTKPSDFDFDGWDKGAVGEGIIIEGDTVIKANWITHVHNMVFVPGFEPTCEWDGNAEHYYCTVCGKEFDDADGSVEAPTADYYIIPATGHTPGTAVKEHEIAATCTEAGGYDEVVYCSVCHTELSRTHTDIPATGHTLTHVPAKAASCTEDGNHAYYECSVCGDWFEDATGAVKITDYNDVIIDALGHDWGEWVQAKAPTTTEEGEETRTCSRCHETETRSIPKLGVTSYDIIVNVGAHGSAHASAGASEEGKTITVTATPNSSYEIDKVTYTPEGGSETDITGSLNFTMPAAKVTVNVTFKASVYTVTVQNDGNGTATANVASGTAGTEVTLTATPNSGYQFKKWQVVSGGVTVTDNKFTIGTENVVVKAIFEEDTSATEYTVTFNANGHGTAPAAQTITSGGTATEPTAPTAEGWNFGGWYQDATCSVAFDFATPITVDIVLYAKWTEVTPGTVYYTVVSGGNSSFTIGNASDIVVTVKRSEADETCFSHFTGVEIDGVALVNGTDYTAVAGSTVVTIKAATLNNLSAGGHTIKVIFDDGEATTSVTAKAASNNNNNSNSSAVPSTGETLAPTLFVGIAFIAVAGMLFAVILVQRKKKTEQR
ncbi:MAG: InlB B-repeat-containing protein [Clostridiales bacterium]|nr:InlB B-repeat-containing protein [Clostridiales bacterium]